MGTLFFDFKEIIPCKECEITRNEKLFINYFMEKILINLEEDEIIVIDETNPVEFGNFLLSVMREYEYYLSKYKNMS